LLSFVYCLMHCNSYLSIVHVFALYITSKILLFGNQLSTILFQIPSPPRASGGDVVSNPAPPTYQCVGVGSVGTAASIVAAAAAMTGATAAVAAAAMASESAATATAAVTTTATAVAVVTSTTATTAAAVVAVALAAA
jgi:hypothetical protein